ncbi:MAG: 4-hydroxy-tetrahydrodipicolinate synthase [Nitrospinota bacterium]|nr:4-hydroxy-tetrahydrodipicolinate synthase [Nitrospinota bacterium]
MFRGSITALVTPFKNGKIEQGHFKDIIEWQIENGTDGIVPCGSTGESATLDYKEHKEAIGLAVKIANGRVKVIAGTGSNSTTEAIELTSAAKDLGADGALLLAPYYNKPTQEGTYLHFMAIADAVEIPQIIYNVPSRTALNILPDTVARLAKHENIVGIKEATGSVEQALHVINLCPKDFLLLSGDDAINWPLLAIGSAGSISVTANVVPKKMSEMHTLFFDGKTAESLKIHYELLELHKVMFIETNPIPVKSALAMMGRVNDEFRLPLTPVSDGARKILEKALRDYKLL